MIIILRKQVASHSNLFYLFLSISVSHTYRHTRCQRRTGRTYLYHPLYLIAESLMCPHLFSLFSCLSRRAAPTRICWQTRKPKTRSSSILYWRLLTGTWSSYMNWGSIWKWQVANHMGLGYQFRKLLNIGVPSLPSSSTTLSFVDLCSFSIQNFSDHVANSAVIEALTSIRPGSQTIVR